MKSIYLKRGIIFLLLVFCFLYSLLFLVSEIYFSEGLYTILITVVVSNLALLYLYLTNGDYLSPNALFIISVLIFLLMRPILSVFGDFEVVSIGLKISTINISKTVIFIILIVNIIAASTIISSSKVIDSYRYIPKINIFNKNIEVLFFVIAITLSLYFLYFSFLGMVKLSSGMSYFEFTEAASFTHLKYFFYAKLCFLISYLFSKEKVSILLIALLCFLASIGFLMIGLRGYTMAYLFLLLSILNLKHKIRVLPLFVISIGVLFVSSLVLNFRLGFDVSSTFIDMIISPFYQQGASFEVVFGAVNFKDDLINCISYSDYFDKKSFGNCVDQVRGVYFAEGGGFASSYFAEVYYFGIVLAILISVAFGVVLSFLNEAYNRLKLNLYTDKLSAVIVFFLIPNLVYFGRSSAFDFISKAVEVLILTFLIIILQRTFSKNG